MRQFVMVFLASMILALPALAALDSETIEDMGNDEYIEPVPGDIWGGPRDLLYDNGPLVNCPGCGVGGADESMLQNVTLLMNVLGFGHQIPSGLWVADDFIVPEGETWCVDSFTFFGYQTNAPTDPSTFTDYHIMIFDDIPPSGNVVFGDDATNFLTGSVWTNIYRVTETTTGTSTARPIFANACALDPGALELPAGQYWVAWQAAGTLSSGPWAPPICIYDVCETGDGLQSTDYGLTFDYVVDSGEYQCPQGFPFVIEGTVCTPIPTENSSWGSIKALFK